MLVLGLEMLGFALTMVLVLPEGATGAIPGPGEVTRLRAHFRTAQDYLAERDPSELTEAQRRNRRARLAALEAYVARGVFPKNRDFPNRRAPYFVDGAGTRCAMAYLIEESGRGDLVERVARTDNNAYVYELAGDEELLGWLDENGLTVDEAAMIQPTYGPNCHQKSSCICGGFGNVTLEPNTAALWARVKTPGELATVVVLGIYGDTSSIAVGDELVLMRSIQDKAEGEEVLLVRFDGESTFYLHRDYVIEDGRVYCPRVDEGLSLDVEAAAEALVADDCYAAVVAASPDFEGEYGPECGCGCSSAGSSASVPAAGLLLLLLAVCTRKSSGRPNSRSLEPEA